MTPSNKPKIARPSDASSTCPHVALPTIHEQFGEAEGSPLFNVAATPATIDAVISSGARTKGVEVLFEGKWCVVKHNVPSDLR